jgi:hypothetical protein
LVQVRRHEEFYEKKLFPCKEKRKIIQIKMATKRIFQSFI